MTVELEYASFSLNDEHGEDDVAVEEGRRRSLLAVVADGVSASDDGLVASRSVVQAAREAFQRCYGSAAEEYDAFETFLETFEYFLAPDVDSKVRRQQSTARTWAEAETTVNPETSTMGPNATAGMTRGGATPVPEKPATIAPCANASSTQRTTDTFPGARRRSSSSGASAQSTATIVVFEPSVDNNSVVARYCAYGDSPIYRAFSEPISPEYPKSYLVLQLHGKPLVTQGSRVYSYIDVANRRFVGRPMVGSFELQRGDICLIMTDGVPAREYIYRDIQDRARSHRFLNMVASKGPERGARYLERWLKKDNALTDDATLIVVRVAKAHSNRTL